MTIKHKTDKTVTFVTKLPLCYRSVGNRFLYVFQTLIYLVTMLPLIISPLSMTAFFLHRGEEKNVRIYRHTGSKKSGKTVTMTYLSDIIAKYCYPHGGKWWVTVTKNEKFSRLFRVFGEGGAI